MTAHSLTRIVSEELAAIGIIKFRGDNKLGIPKRTVWSLTLPGFGIRYYYSGRKVYVLQSTMAGKQRLVTLGNASILTKAEAIDVAKRILLRAQTGENPAEERARIRSAPRYDIFLEEYWHKASPGWKPLTLKTHDSYRGNYLGSAFKGKFIDEIDKADVLKWFAWVSDTGGPGAANRAMSILNAAFGKAEQWGYINEGSNPCRGIRPNRRKKLECFLSNDELARLGRAFEELKSEFPVQVTALQILALTGCRRSEILKLTWSEVRGNRLQLTDSKTGPRTVWVGDEVRELIANLPRRPDQKQIFVTDSVSDLTASVSYVWRRLREHSNLNHVRLHDLRHSFASHAAAMSETLPMIGKLLGHASVQSTARYAHLDDGSVLQAAERIGNLIDKVVYNISR
ncbi:MAG: tyrosine-type recombinase/integrase [Parasphingorhabdus sp.]|uniref:tyrosine-type recombinase/integrase n=1 Tax=Parasphingorhabdus sp. TaxID=2709688 RepID=UPI003001F643